MRFRKTRETRHGTDQIRINADTDDYTPVVVMLAKDGWEFSPTDGMKGLRPDLRTRSGCNSKGLQVRISAGSAIRLTHAEWEHLRDEIDLAWEELNSE